MTFDGTMVAVVRLPVRGTFRRYFGCRMVGSRPRRLVRAVFRLRWWPTRDGMTVFGMRTVRRTGVNDLQLFSG